MDVKRWLINPVPTGCDLPTRPLIVLCRICCHSTRSHCLRPHSHWNSNQHVILHPNALGKDSGHKNIHGWKDKIAGSSTDVSLVCGTNNCAISIPTPHKVLHVCSPFICAYQVLVYHLRQKCHNLVRISDYVKYALISKSAQQINSRKSSRCKDMYNVYYYGISFLCL